jgi:translation initiation factor IF-3
LADALKRAELETLDLVQIADSDPVVCRIMDYGKKIFEEKKQKAAAKKKQKQIQVKEIKFRPGTEEGDYQVKLRNLIRFLEEGDKAKVTLRFRGREMAHSAWECNSSTVLKKTSILTARWNKEPSWKDDRL